MTTDITAAIERLKKLCDSININDTLRAPQIELKILLPPILAHLDALTADNARLRDLRDKALARHKIVSANSYRFCSDCMREGTINGGDIKHANNCIYAAALSADSTARKDEQ
jgi:hypothetical protein